MLLRQGDLESLGARRFNGLARQLVPGNRILVPLIRGQAANALLRIGDAVAARCAARGLVLSLVEIPHRWSGVMSSAVVRSRDLLRWIAANDYTPGTEGGRLGIQSRFTADPAASIHESLLETQCDIVLAEWPTPVAQRQHRLRSILRALVTYRQAALVVARPDPAASCGIQPGHVVAPLRGGPNAWLALSVAVALAGHSQARLTLLHVYDKGHHRELRRHEEAVFQELIQAAQVADPQIVELLSDHPVEAMFKEARLHDTVILGAHSNSARRGALLGNELTRAMDELDKTVILTRNGLDQPFAA